MKTTKYDRRMHYIALCSIALYFIVMYRHRRHRRHHRRRRRHRHRCRRRQYCCAEFTTHTEYDKAINRCISGKRPRSGPHCCRRRRRQRRRRRHRSHHCTL